MSDTDTSYAFLIVLVQPSWWRAYGHTHLPFIYAVRRSGHWGQADPMSFTSQHLSMGENLRILQHPQDPVSRLAFALNNPWVHWPE